tara:strand:+ start:2821 stop:3243 length:423 start_codon:yes stop_codon:yes gene_type:complete
VINYQKILNENMIQVFKDILKEIKDKGLSNGNHLYITFETIYENTIIPQWLIEKYPNDMTIVIQHEFYDIEIKEKYFNITLSFDDIKTNLKISYESIISFADPSSNFGLVLKSVKSKKIIKKKNLDKKNNVINFSNFKKN